MAVTALWSRNAGAQSDYGPAYECKDCIESGPRTLAGHTYVPSTLLDWAFVVSQFSSTTTAGRAEFALGPRDSAIGDLLQLEGNNNFVYAQQTFFAGLAIRDWVSVSVIGQGAGVIPSDRLSALFAGAHALYGGNALASFRLVRTDRFQLGAIGDVGYSWSNDLVPARLPESPHFGGHVTTLRPALALAYSFNRIVGFQASGTMAWRFFDIGVQDTVMTLSGGGALTIRPDAIPVTLLVAGQGAHDYGEGDAIESSMRSLTGTGDTQLWGEAGLAYTGRSDFDLGAALQWKINDTHNDSRWLAQVRLAYYL